MASSGSLFAFSLSSSYYLSCSLNLIAATLQCCIYFHVCCVVEPAALDISMRQVSVSMPSHKLCCALNFMAAICKVLTSEVLAIVAHFRASASVLCELHRLEDTAMHS